MNESVPTRTAILATLLHNLDMVRQWYEMNSFRNADKYEIRAEVLTELLEVHDCGSVGGYDKGQGTLLDRFDCLLAKYDMPLSSWLEDPGSSSFDAQEAYKRVSGFCRLPEEEANKAEE